MESGWLIALVLSALVFAVSRKIRGPRRLSDRELHSRSNNIAREKTKMAVRHIASRTRDDVHENDLIP